MALPFPLSRPRSRLPWRHSLSHPSPYLPWRHRPLRTELRSFLLSPATSLILMDCVGFRSMSNLTLGCNYRRWRGAVCLAMGELNADPGDFEEILERTFPDDPDAMKELKECDKAERRSAADSIDHTSTERRMPFSILVGIATTLVLAAVWVATNPLSRSYVADLVAKASSPSLADIPTVSRGALFLNIFSDMVPQYSVTQIQDETFTLDFIKKMIEDFMNQKPLDKRCAYAIIKKTREVLSPLPSLVDIIVPDGQHLTVCGDIHGQKKEYEAALVGAFRREKDKDLALQGLTAENQAAMKLNCTDEFSDYWRVFRECHEWNGGRCTTRALHFFVL